MNRQEYKNYTDDLKLTAYKMGKSAFGVFEIPNDDKEFISLLLDHTRGYTTDNKKMKLQLEMYKAYRKGCERSAKDFFESVKI